MDSCWIKPIIAIGLVSVVESHTDLVSQGVVNVNAKDMWHLWGGGGVGQPKKIRGLVFLQAAYVVDFR